MPITTTQYEEPTSVRNTGNTGNTGNPTPEYDHLQTMVGGERPDREKETEEERQAKVNRKAEAQREINAARFQGKGLSGQNLHYEILAMQRTASGEWVFGF